MSDIPNPTRELYQSLRSELIGIHYRLRVLRQLFTSQETVDLLNKTAYRFFNTLRNDLLDTIVLMTNHLLDPAKTKKYSNASLQQLIDALDSTAYPGLVANLEDIREKIKSKSSRIENCRMKWGAHRDFDVLLGQASMPKTSLIEIDEVLGLIGEFLNEFERICQNLREEINLYDKSVFEVKEIAENERLKINPPIDYENMAFQDDGRTILDLIIRASSLQ
ncbi:MAG: hypothetical protein Q8L41_13605 [Anaerolineales bacterium]|nr:hypothetical protein [Anaerolineales bacterium]